MNEGSGITGSQQATSGSGGGNTNTKSVTATLNSGDNVKAHGVTGTIMWINVYETATKRPLEFSNFYWDSTNIHVWGDETIDVTFSVFYQS